MLFQMTNIINLSNSLSFLRIFLSIPIFYYIANDEKMYALMIISIAMVTDILDGYFARKLKQITSAGKVLDPIADKICTISGFLALSIYSNFPVWMTGLIIGRDILILIGSLLIWNSKKTISASNIPGKMAMFSISLLGLIYLLDIQPLKEVFIYITFILLVFSFFMYVKLYIEDFGKNE